MPNTDYHSQPATAHTWVLFSVAVLCGWWLWLAACLWPQWSFYEIYEYGLFVPFLALGLVWRRWLSVPEPETPRVRLWLLPVLLLAAGLLLPVRMIYEANSLWRTISWPLGIAVMTLVLGGIYYLGGRAWLRHFSFPILFFLSALPWPGSLENSLVRPFQMVNTAVAAEALFLCGIPAIQMGNTIDLSTGQVGVDEACSGIRSFHSTMMMALFLGEMYRLRARARIILLMGGLALAFLANFLRTFLLSWVCATKGAGEMGRWHDPLGLLVVVLCMGGVWALALWRRPPKTPVAGTDESSASQARPVGMLRPLPRVLFVGLAIWLVLVEVGTRVWFQVRESKMTSRTAWSFVLPEGSSAIAGTAVYKKALDRAFKADEIQTAAWSEADGSQWNLYYLRWGHGSKTAQIAKGHWPETCLANSGKVLCGQPEVKLFETQGLKLPFRSYVFDDNGRSLCVFHCVWGEQVGSAPKLDVNMQPRLLSRLESAWNGERNLGQQMLEVAVWGFQDAQAAELAFKGQLERMVKVNQGDSNLKTRVPL